VNGEGEGEGEGVASDRGSFREGFHERQDLRVT
jgi:hypothetical protein